MEKLKDYEILSALNPLPPNFTLKILDEVGSTNEVTKQLAQEGSPENMVVFSEKQTAGKGRLDRAWESPAYKNLYFSILLRPTLSPDKTPQINLLAGLAAFRCFFQLAPHGLRLKWPNDLWIKNKKAGGILTEMEPKASGGVNYIVVGVGLNVNSDSSDYSPAIQAIATSLKTETQEEYSRSKIAGMFLNEFFNLYSRYQSEGLKPFIYEWENASQMKGKKVKVEDGSNSFEGICTGINSNGYLTVNANGKTETVIAGDVSWI